MGCWIWPPGLEFVLFCLSKKKTTCFWWGAETNWQHFYSFQWESLIWEVLWVTSVVMEWIRHVSQKHRCTQLLPIFSFHSLPTSVYLLAKWFEIFCNIYRMFSLCCDCTIPILDYLRPSLLLILSFDTACFLIPSPHFTSQLSIFTLPTFACFYHLLSVTLSFFFWFNNHCISAPPNGSSIERNLLGQTQSVLGWSNCFTSHRIWEWILNHLCVELHPFKILLWTIQATGTV